MKLFRGVVLIAALSPLLTAQAQSTRVLSFPGPQKQLISPDGEVAVVNHDPGRTKNNGSPAHLLRLRELGSGRNSLLFRYIRKVEVSWAPDSRALFVTDEKGPDESQAYVLFPRDERKVLDISKLIDDSYAGDRKFVGADHAFIKAEGWLSATQVAVRLTGHDKKLAAGGNRQGGFTVCYVVNVDRTIQRNREYSEEGHRCPQK